MRICVKCFVSKIMLKDFFFLFFDVTEPLLCKYKSALP